MCIVRVLEGDRQSRTVSYCHAHFSHNSRPGSYAAVRAGSGVRNWAWKRTGLLYFSCRPNDYIWPGPSRSAAFPFYPVNVLPSLPRRTEPSSSLARTWSPWTTACSPEPSVIPHCTQRETLSPCDVAPLICGLAFPPSSVPRYLALAAGLLQARFTPGRL